MKIRRKAGLFLYKTIGNILPKRGIGRKFRGFCAKLCLKECGKNVDLYPKCIFSTQITIGDNSGIGYKSYIQGKCIIGANVMMGPEVNIWTVNHEHSDTDIPMNQQGNEEEKPVYIGDDVWIGSRTIILPGVHIGNHVIIGAGTVVTKNIPDYSVVCGNPGKIVKTRKISEE